MNEKVLNTKNEILQWVRGFEDEGIIRELLNLKLRIEKLNLVSEPQTKMKVKVDFEERWASLMNSEQSRAESKRKIRDWWEK